MSFEWMIKRGSLFVLVASLTACGGMDPDEEMLETTEDALIGGSSVFAGQWDSTLSIPGCTAAKVGPRHILTAAHCVQSRSGNEGRGTIQTTYRPGRSIRITNGKRLSSASFFNRTVSSTQMHPSWVSACSGGCPNHQATLPPFPADVALIRLTSDLPASIPTARIDARPVALNETMTILGYGCQTSLNRTDSTPRRLKFERLRNQLPLNPFMSGEYIASPGLSQNSTEASLCPGDSGGPVYRGWGTTSRNIVGVNAYYFFVTNNGISWQNLHTELSRNNPHNVAQWLRARLPAGRVIGL